MICTNFYFETEGFVFSIEIKSTKYVVLLKRI